MAKAAALGLGLLALAACDLPTGANRPEPPSVTPPTVSEKSQSLRNYYAALQADELARGLLRTDGGGPDTPYTADMLARNFERIAFYGEYAEGANLQKPGGQSGGLRRWAKPVRFHAEFGASVPDAMRTQDLADIRAYASRLAAATGHSISYSGIGANFHVLVMSEDDKDQLTTRIRQLVPNADPRSAALLRDLPRSIQCIVMTTSDPANPYEYTAAVAVVRAEHPDLLRKSCYHEEMAQGLGLANDSPNARPSIFNDDDEFALLTTHDEALLAMLYDPRLSIGMPLDQARPILSILAREQTGQAF